MKHSLLSLAVLLCACVPDNGPPARPEHRAPVVPPPAKTIIAKESAVEQKLSGFDLIWNAELKTRTVTVYYLVADDGTVAEVGLSQWAKTKIGEKYATHGWITK